ncbi:HD-GYP domain-containing protein [Alkaliphilus serpentinus]|nr:HD domain-containing phosphohydrolase [Alkaliphilus serpentinus]
MKSIKKIIAVLGTLLLVILLTISLLTLFYYRNIFNKLEDLGLAIDEAKGSYLEMDLPIKVLNNVIQMDTSNGIDIDRAERMREAYIDNHKALLEKTETLNAKGKKIVDATEALIKWRLLFRDDYSTLMEAVDNASATIMELLPYIEALTPTEENKSNTIYEAMNKYLEIENSIKAASQQLDSLKRKTTDEYMHVNLWGYLVLILIAFTLGAILTKLLRKTIPYIMEGFKKLDRHHYDIDSLPRLHTQFSEEEMITNLVTSVLNEQAIIHQIKNIAGSKFLLTDVIDNIFEITKDVLSTDRIGVAFVDYSTNAVIAEHGVFKYNQILLGPGFKVSFKDTTLEKLIKGKESKITHDIYKELKRRPHSESLKLLKDEGIKSNMIIPVIVNDIVIALLFFSSCQEYNYDLKSLRLGENIAYELSSIISKTYLTQKMFIHVTRTFADIVEKKDPETGEHLNRMTSYSKVIAEGLLNHHNTSYSVNQSYVNDIENNAAIHDIGKVGVPDIILNKPGKLNSVEWQAMKQHTTIGAEVLFSLKESLKIFNNNFFEMAIEIAKYHHERWDGTGYPEGLSGLDIPLSARITAIADVFDAVSSKRVYKDPSSFEDTVALINQGSGTHFDPQLVEVFNQSLDKIRMIYEGEDANKNAQAS